ncbi:metal-dependent phosphohydrolase HD sub domain [Caldicellulosiruptor kronotskyensis 2002]|uniref:Metal-dependent phosphohydrolase HD sub domain n=1 Tax=Caldicellulosiruptor kronotskyensis (strain DSM 18902 / VKM B-2412 / 2002) TaxID=632348 RepID=E4SCW1_CALK2|nr:HD domain-containing protein [Caldicellulosiruptor kronotskyensis]ADQ45094.1 metal-dependent phosphohydrolase HD sub domain [Caldicellulosiruptor kronotskyensis 2002]
MDSIDLIALEMIKYFKNDVRRINHALKVFSFARLIGKAEGLDGKKQYILEAAALLHDIGIKVCEQKYGSTAGHLQEIEGPEVAKEILSHIDVEKDKIERILFLIGNHHSYSKIDDIDFQILVEADFLVNIHEDSMDVETIKSIKHKYFKTKMGLFMLEKMFEV